MPCSLLRLISLFTGEICLMKILTIALLLLLTACSSVPAAKPEKSAAAEVSTAPVTTATTSTTVETGKGVAVEAPVVPATSASTSHYVIQPGDVLEISVWKEKDLQKEIMVRPDGGLNFPLAGYIQASGKTLEQLQKELTTKLVKYVPDPVVTVSVKQSLGNKIYVVGKVNKPGDFIAIRNMDVMQALSMSGGPTPYASVNKIKILRRENGELKAFPFKYSRVEKGEDLEQNIILQGGDVVVVP